MQLPEKLMDQTWKNDKKLILGLILAHLAQIRIPNFFFLQVLPQLVVDIVSNYHPMQFKEKLTNHT